MNEEIRAVTLYAAKLVGLIPDEYIFKDLPEEFIATLQYKVWGKSRNLKLFFCCDGGEKYVLSVFAKSYAPKSMPEFDLSSSSILVGMKFKLKTKINRNGNINLLEAYIFSK